MTDPAFLPETVHATCVVVQGTGVLLYGRSGSGKSDLALRLIDRGAGLVSDDYTTLRRRDRTLTATCPPEISGKMEVRGIGIIECETVEQIPISLCVVLDEPVERMPPERFGLRRFSGIDVPAIALHALEASAPIKVELAAGAIRQGAQREQP